MQMKRDDAEMPINDSWDILVRFMVACACIATLTRGSLYICNYFCNQEKSVSKHELKSAALIQKSQADLQRQS